MTRVRIVSTVSVICSIVFCCATAFAGNPGGLTKPDAIEHFKKGNALYNAGDFAEAVKEYKAGMLAESSAVFNFNLGQSYRQLGDYTQAKWHYQRYLNSGLATNEEREAIEKVIAKMDAELQQKARTEPPTAPQTSIDRAPPAAAPSPSPATTTDTSSPWYQDGIGWGLTGVGVASGAVSGVLFLQSADLENDADAAPSAGQAQALRDKAATRSTAGTIVGIAGGAFLIAGVVKLVIHPSSPQAPTTVTLGVAPSGVWVSGRF